MTYWSHRQNRAFDRISKLFIKNPKFIDLTTPDIISSLTPSVSFYNYDMCRGISMC